MTLKHGELPANCSSLGKGRLKKRLLHYNWQSDDLYFKEMMVSRIK